MLTACQKAVQKKVIEVCGSLSECQAFDDDTVIGTDSLISYTDTNGDTRIDGIMNFGLLDVDDSDKSNPKFSQSSIRNVKNGISDQAIKSRIDAAIKTVENSATQKINLLSTDPTIKMCVNGRDENWRYSKSQKESGEQNNFQRFPNILDSYMRMVFNSALSKAAENYRVKYDEMVADALRAQSDDEKAMACTMMAYDKNSVTCTRPDDGKTVCEADDSIGNLFNELYKGNTAQGVLKGSYIIKRANIEKKLELMSHNSSQIVLLNDYGSMISLVTMKAFYSPGSKICTITTTTSECLSEKEIVYLSETDYVKDKKYEDGTTKKYVCDDCEYKYEGVLCDKYSEPVEKVTEIQM